MRQVTVAKDPAVLSYYALRRAVGYVALFLPFALSIPWLFWQHKLELSISDYYHTGMRNLFVGSLCAIGLFMLCARGFDKDDEHASTISAVCALGVAFCRTTPDGLKLDRLGALHLTFAAILFLTLAYFCLRLFQTSVVGQPMTVRKTYRNRVYTVCGWVILCSMALIALLVGILHQAHLLGFGTTFVFETTSLLAFGCAWLVKGQAVPFLRDEPTPARNGAATGK